MIPVNVRKATFVYNFKLYINITQCEVLLKSFFVRVICDSTYIKIPRKFFNHWICSSFAF